MNCFENNQSVLSPLQILFLTVDLSSDLYDVCIKMFCLLYPLDITLDVSSKFLLFKLILQFNFCLNWRTLVLTSFNASLLFSIHNELRC